MTQEEVKQLERIKKLALQLSREDLSTEEKEATICAIWMQVDVLLYPAWRK